MTQKIISRTGSGLLSDVVYLEMELKDGGSEIIECEPKKYHSMRAQGCTDEQIFEMLTWAHDTPTLEEIKEELHFDEKVRRFSQCWVDQNKRRAHLSEANHDN